MDKSVRPVFTLELNYKIIPGLVTIGKYDGTHPCLTAATSTEKVLIHSPHRRNISVHGRINYSESNREIATLNINQTITAIVAGIFIPEEDKDILVIGATSHILVYHVHDNRDIFYKECPDGVKALAIGNFGESTNKLLLVGGNSSIHGYKHDGQEVFWTSVGDVITSMILMDFNKDSSEELIVSSEDFKIRIFKWDTLLSENTETEVVTHLVCLPENRFAYAVSNGTIGVYEQDARLWRVKSKNFAIDMQSYDLIGQGTPQLITGWSNGKMDCRSIKTGEVFFKDTMNSSVAGIVEGDYRSMGKTDVIALSQEGEMRGYTTTKSLSLTSSGGSDQETVRELLAQKQALLMEFKHYENNNSFNNNSNSQLESFESQGVIPANTRLQIGIAANEGYTKERFIEIFISTNNSTIIRSVTIFAEGIFKGETHVVHPADHQISSDLTIPLNLPSDNPVDIHIKAFVGYPKSEQYHVFEITRQLPRFSMYALNNGITDAKPESYVEFRMNERLQRICMWINQNFLLSSDVEIDGGPSLELSMKCLRDGSILVMFFEVIGRVKFYTDNIGLAADLVQSLAVFLNLDTLESKAHFPEEEEQVKELILRLSEIQETRMKLGTDVADRLGQVRTLVIKAEDARINNVNEMGQYYKDLDNLNKELINGYNIRLNNHTEGLESVKKINTIIQRFSRLRGIVFFLLEHLRF
ncbi:Bardet-Biedl syndrome 2 protein-like [Coccinella septempunctata]|uniref:Bardet-Biedl syndrome 2 protein-like n=1 Tax=Coccinella septempunctata TaxID=41139 RepID=UPI001D09875F|nr:Bardet-Biedl syndrome 2 protein-like [Coccinella septempunctata]